MSDVDDTGRFPAAPAPEDQFTLTLRVENTTAVVPDGEKDTCDTCDEPVWVSQATRQEIARGLYPSTLRCLDCAIEEAGDE